MNKLGLSLVTILLPIALVACGSSSKKSNNTEEQTTTERKVDVPLFNADSAYNYIQKQVDFGPRVPNSKGHKECADFLEAKLAEFGAKTYRQNFDAIAYDGTILQASNIIGAYKPESKKRVALFAHWDTRPWADNDPDKANHHTPILGANDGASGVGVLLEIARQIQKKEPSIGIDIIFFDAEDYGAPQFYKGIHKEEHWCLGSQYWSRVPHVENYFARFGILLDMVGAKNATFYKERISTSYANNIVKKVWSKARELGYSNYFINKDGWEIIDDHLFINKLTNIKTIDIIPYYPNNEKSSFGNTWHTVKDNMDDIDTTTLNAVGQTVLAVIYNEQ
ncbi:MULTISPECIES: M20 family metallopeptidase [Bacteroides]|uniref:M20 family metallopeptidase n=1 Tax=Bacteroides TaxID=816 RepID=UPI001DCCFF92|nr:MULTISPECIES: M28 family peptidase [Bacteroides]HJD91609.1 M28 family peptidase [Bacteroides coprosuis]